MSKKSNLVGQSFGYLTVISENEKRDKSGNVCWNCQCICGNMVVKTTHYLKHNKQGENLSCGCMKKNNLTGKRIGYLTVIRDSGNRNNNHSILWECRCDCGNIVYKEGKSLLKIKHPEFLSCGCKDYDVLCREGLIKGTGKAYHVGEKVGELTIIGESGRNSCDNSIMWKCNCSCGKTLELSSDKLYSLGKSKHKSCGCKKATAKDLTGKTFGRLTVLYENFDKRIPNDRHGKRFWHCVCSCDEHTEVDVEQWTLENMKTVSCGCLQKEFKEWYIDKDGKYQEKKKESPLIKDYTGYKFGKLTWLEPIDMDNEKRHNRIWKCRCDCGNITYVSTCEAKSTQSCGCLLSGGELLIEKELTSLGISFIKQQKFNDCINPKTGYNLRFDFFLPEYNTAIEFNGMQHEHPVEYFGGQQAYQDLVYRDNLKKEYCQKYDIKLIVIPYKDKEKINQEYLLNLLSKC